MKTTNPLLWPEGWPKTNVPEKWALSKLDTLAHERDRLLWELDRLGASAIELTCNGALNKDGSLSARQTKLTVTGIAVYFVWKLERYVVACDCYTSLEANFRGCASTIASLRTIWRHHSTALLQRLLVPLRYRTHQARPDQAQGQKQYTNSGNETSSGERSNTSQQKKSTKPPPRAKERPNAEPPPPPPKPKPPRHWSVVLGILNYAHTPFADVKKTYRTLAHERHPDKGGTDEAFQELKEAWEQAKLYYNEQ